MSIKRWLGICLLLQLGLLAVVWHKYAVGDFNDDATYLATARSLARGLPYQDLFQVGSPARVRFPPGYPLLLAPFQADLTWARAEAFAFSLAATAVFLFYTGRVECGLLLAANAFWAYTGTTVMSESVFSLALLLYLRHLQSLPDAPSARLFFLGLAAALCYYLRAVGLLLVPATLLWRRRCRWRGQLAFVVGFGLGAGPSALGKILSGYDGEFAGQQQTWWQTCQINLQFIPTSWGSALLGGLPAVHPVVVYLFWLVFGLSLYGLWRLRGEHPGAVWTACYLLAMLGWPFHQIRFSVPALPFLVLGLGHALGWKRPLIAAWLGLELWAAVLNYAPPRPGPAAELHVLAGKIPPGRQLAADTMDLGIYENIPAFGRPARELFEQDWVWEQALLDHQVGLVVFVRAGQPVKDALARRPAVYTAVHDTRRYSGFTFHPVPRAVLLHTAARAALQQQRWTTAERLFRTALRLDPSHSTLHSGLGYALAHLDRLPEARWEVAQALQLDPANAEAPALARFLGP